MSNNRYATDCMRCQHCGKPINQGRAVLLELDQRTDTYHDFGNVPQDRSQGWFEFGPDCAKKLRAAALKAQTA